MILKDYHVHTDLCDGKSKAEDTVLKAIEMGVKTLGFSGHAYTDFDTSYCMTPESTELYKCEINRLKEKYADKIEILCGIELDLYSDADPSDFDYAIGSVHFIKKDGEFVPVDLKPHILKDAADKFFEGDIYALTEAYYAEVEKLKDKKIDIVGHIDLITKFSEKSDLFDQSNPRYIAAAEKAADALIPLNIPFEINTGVIIRGYKSTPYPAPFLLDKITRSGGSFILNSDSHGKDMLCFEFEKWHDFAQTHNVKWHNEKIGKL